MYNDCMSIFNTYTNTDQTLITDAPLIFNTNRVKAGHSISHSAGTSTICLNRPGIYAVHFNGDAAESGVAGDITVQLFVNGVLQPGAEATESSSVVTGVVNLAFKTLVCVTPNFCNCGNSASLTFVDTGVGAVFSNAEVVVIRLR